GIDTSNILPSRLRSSNKEHPNHPARSHPTFQENPEKLLSVSAPSTPTLPKTLILPPPAAIINWFINCNQFHKDNTSYSAPQETMNISKIVNEAIAEALKKIPQLNMQCNQPPTINQPQPQPTNHHFPLQTNYHIFENSHYAHHQPQYPQHPQFPLETPRDYFQHENVPVPNIY
ncbi:hypothetical protein GcC1_145012, partial [Golovinomyces cichoracearum]